MALLQYDISVVGIDNVRAAMRAVESEMTASNRRSLGVGTGAGRAGAAGIGRAANENASTRAAEAAFRAQELRGIREHDRAERIKSTATEREARRRAQAELAINRQRSAALYRIYQAEEREKRRLESLTAHARARTVADVTRATKSVLGGTAGRVASIGKGAIAMTGLAGGALFAGAVHGAMSRGASAAGLASQLAGNDATAKSLQETKEKVLTAASATRGYSTQDVIAGMSEFQATAGEAEATMKVAPHITEMGLATGADIVDLGKMYSSVYASIRNGTGGAAKSVDQLLQETDKIARVFAAMGQKGAIELKDIASIGPELAAVAGRYGGDQVTNIKNIGALAQIARQTGGAPSASEASTAVQSFATDLIQHGKEIRKMGVNVYSDESQTALKELPKLVPELMAATGGNLEKLQEVANIRGIKSLTGFSAQYNEAYRAARANKATDKEAKEAGKSVVRKRFDEFGALEMKTGEVKTKADARMLESDKQLEEQMRALSAAVGKELLPTIIKLIPEVSKLIPPFVTAAKMFATAVKYISDAPIQSAFAILGLAFLAEVAKLRIANIINAAVAKGAAASVTNRASKGALAATTLGGISGGAVAAPAGGKLAGVGAGLLGAINPIMTGLTLGTMAYEGISIGGRQTYDSAKTGTDAIMKDLSTQHGAMLGPGIVEAEQKLKEIEDSAGIFGKFLDVFGAGPAGEIESAQDMIVKKRAEYDRWQGGEKLSAADQADLASRAKLAASGPALMDAAVALSEAATKMGGGSPSVKVNTKNTPTVPVK